MGTSVDCWFDYSSPFAYLGTTQIERVAHEVDAEVRFRPFLLGALFKAIGGPIIPLHSFPDAKRRHEGLDLTRWAAHWGVPFRFTSKFPINSIAALRVTLLAGCEPRLIHRIMRAAWADDEDIALPEVLVRCLEDEGFDPGLVERAREAKADLIAATEEAVAIGCPGAPCFVVGEQLYWGQDRLVFVKAALEGRPPGGL